MRATERHPLRAVQLVILLAGACAGPVSPRGGAIADGASQQTPQRKAIAIAVQAEINALTSGINQVGANSPPSRYFHEFTNAYLTHRDQNDEVRPWVAVELPSVEAGTWKLAPDGRMEVAWKLRQGVKWHDGKELTSDDVKFAWEAAREPAAQVRPQGVASLIEGVDAPDPYTVVFHWRRTSYQGGEMGEGQLDPLPRHVLEETLLTDKDNFSSHPYFAVPERFVGAGPYRPIHWERGAQISLEAFDQYFLGRPRTDQVTFKFLRDPQTGMANVLAGSVDISYQALGFEQARIIREEFAKSNGGTVDLQLNHVRHLLPQLRPEHASPADLLNVQVRRALLHAMDRSEIAEAVLPGIGQPADSITYPTSAIGTATAQSVVKYPHDPARAASLFEAAGWRRGPDGVLQKGSERFTMEYRSSGASADAAGLFPVLQQQWLRSGVDAQFHEVATTQTPTDTALYPGVWYTSLPPDSNPVLTRFHSRQIAAPENRYAAGNRTGYASPAVDRFIDAIDSSLRMEDRARNWAEMWRVLTEDLALFPMYYFPTPYVVRARITGALPANQLSAPVYQVHAWDVR